MLDGPAFPENWPRRPIYELATWTNGLAFRDFQFSDSGWPVIKIAELKEGVSGQTRFTRQTFDERYHVKNGDMLFSWSGNPETSLDVFWWRRGDGWLNQHIFKVEPKDVDSGFFYYLLRYLRSTFGEIAANKQTTGLGHVTAGDLKSLLVGVPPSRVQQNIAHVLSSLDDKIELNRRMNQTLEEVCRALFKFWFVDFGPVRAKVEGRWKKGESLPGCPADLRDLWPSDFEESEIGEIPKGWEVEGLGEVSTCRREMVDPSEIDPEGRYVGLEHITPKSLTLSSWGRVGDTVSGKVRFKRGDVLFGKLRPYFHKVCVPSFEGVASTDILSIRPKTSHWLGFVLGHLDSSALVDFATAASNGTKMPRTNWADLASWQVAVPSPELAQAYSTRIAPMISKLGSAIDESSMLAAARDALLPKLLSGEIRVEGDT